MASDHAKSASLAAVGGLIVMCVLAGLARPAQGQSRPAAPARAPVPEPAFLVSRFDISYARDNPNNLPLADLKDMAIPLAKAADGLGAPEPGQATVAFRLAATLEPPLRFRAGAIRKICEVSVGFLNRRGLVGVVVAPSEQDIDPGTMKDIRPAGRTALRLVIYAGRVTRVTASGNTSRPGAAASPSLRRIIEGSPVQAAGSGQPRALDLLRKDMLDEYTVLLGRHPGRRVDAAVSPAGGGDVALDYRVSESKTPSVYAQVSNTGALNTRLWRQMFGVIDNQLTGNDDILSLAYATDGFRQEHTVAASYEAPLGHSQRFRWRVYNNFAKGASADLGVAGSGFSQRDEQFGGELIWNFFQRRTFFLDLVTGASGRAINTRSADGLRGQGRFFVPYAGLRAEDVTESRSLWASAMLEGAAATGATGEDDLALLGREDPDRRWMAAKYNAGASVFLDAPGSQAGQARANEVAASLRGQWTPGYRLIPQAQEPMGGLYSVRGYPEAIAAGDSALVATAEYRWHVLRAMAAAPGPDKTRFFDRPFRPGLQDSVGWADWDLVLKTFYDVGATTNNARREGEFNETLMGWGVGVELRYRQNFSIRCDWAMALKDMESHQVEAGSDRFHVLMTFSW